MLEILKIVVVFTVAVPMFFSDAVNKEHQESIADLLKLLLDKGAIINGKDGHRYTPLHYSVQSSNYEDTKFLLENGADVHALTFRNNNPLHIATEIMDSVPVIELLLEQGADINAKEARGRTPLHNALKNINHKKNNSFSAVQLLIEKGADVNAKDDQGLTPLSMAMGFLQQENNGSWPFVRLLVEKGADVNTKFENRKTLLQFSFEHKNYEMAAFLISHGADIKEVKNLGEIVFDLISNKENVLPLMKLLIEKGFDVNTKSKETLLYHSIEYSSCELAVLFIHGGATMKGNNRERLLRLVAGKDNSIDLMKLLLEKGANIDAKSEHGFTALHNSILYKKYENAKFLVNRGADVRILDHSAKSALHMAVENTCYGGFC